MPFPLFSTSVCSLKATLTKRKKTSKLNKVTYPWEKGESGYPCMLFHLKKWPILSLTAYHKNNKTDGLWGVTLDSQDHK